MLALKILQWRFPKDFSGQTEDEVYENSKRRIADIMDRLFEENHDEDEKDVKSEPVKQEEDRLKGQELLTSNL